MNTRKPQLFILLASISLLLMAQSTSVNDDEILKNLDFYMNLDLMEKMELVQPQNEIPEMPDAPEALKSRKEGGAS